ncbi:phage tail protein [Pantoea sp. At-9b]|uniref:phage tail protein n=1 Tax=Pantoea sp. (strain At-9b) TaxID=592316 RepID=UPI0001B3F20B|nr:phage tail protein [Pantoea sp. At-9b]ADU70711.1 Phage-related tail fibre protein-like protein [Pantoea sp. At-9b]
MTKFYAIVTTLGAAKIANAVSLGTKLNITQMAVGDGGGTTPTPNASQTKLVNEARRAAINSLTIDSANGSQIIAEQVIPETEGGFWIREMGLFDADGTLIAVCNTAETYKPQLQEGSGRTQRLRMILIVSSTDAITLKVDPSVVLATRQYVDEQVLEVRQYADSLMAAHLKATDPHTQYAPKASPELTGIPKAPTAAAGNNSTQLATTAFVTAALAALAGSAPAALDTLKELADALGNDPNFSATVLNALAGKMDIAKNGSDIPSAATFIKNLGLADSTGTVGRLIKTTIFISSGTFTPQATTKKIRVRGVGTGGNGAGSPATSANTCAACGGGAGAGYAEAWFSTFPASIPVTIGAAGALTYGTGNQGGTCSFGSLVTIPGGLGGAVASNSTTAAFSEASGGGRTSPTLLGQDSGIVTPGQIGEFGKVYSGYSSSGRGGHSLLGSGGPIAVAGSGSAASGNGGSGCGAGGGGAALSYSAAAVLGGLASTGVFIVEEFA